MCRSEYVLSCNCVFLCVFDSAVFFSVLNVFVSVSSRSTAMEVN